MVFFPKPSRFLDRPGHNNTKQHQETQGVNFETPRRFGRRWARRRSVGRGHVPGAEPPDLPTARSSEPSESDDAPKPLLHDYVPMTKVTRADPVWSAYVQEAHPLDKEMLEAWSNNMDVLLVFASLFSAILTAFLLEVHQELKQSPSGLANVYLATIIGRLDQLVDNSTAPSMLDDYAPFKVSPRSFRVNLCWFSSFACSLLAAAGAMLAKQWLREYARGSTLGSPYEQAQLRQRRYEGLEAWSFEEVVDLLPSLMHIAIVFFFAGLIDFLWGLQKVIAIIVVTVSSVMITGVVSLNLAAIHSPSCPYRTPLTKHVGRLGKAIGAQLSASYQYIKLPLNIKSLPLVSQATEWISANIRNIRPSSPLSTKASTIDETDTLLWLLRNSRDQDTVYHILTMVPALVTSYKCRAQLAKMGVVAQICQIFDSPPSHPTKPLENEESLVSYGLALHALLEEPVPESMQRLLERGEFIQQLSKLVEYIHARLVPNWNINLAILASSFVPWLCTRSGENEIDPAPIWWVLLDEAGRIWSQSHMAAPWARVLLLKSLPVFIGDIRRTSWWKQGDSGRCEGFHGELFKIATELGRSMPPNYITRQFFAVFILNMISFFAPPVAAVDRHPGSIVNDDVEDLLEKLLGVLLLETQWPVLHYQKDIALIAVLSMKNTLDNQEANVGFSQSLFPSKLIDYACSTSRQGVVELTLNVALDPQALRIIIDNRRAMRLLWLCIRNLIDAPDVLHPNKLLKRMSCIRQALSGTEVINRGELYQTLLDEVEGLRGFIEMGLEHKDDDVQHETLKLVHLVFCEEIIEIGTARELANRLVCQGLLNRLLDIARQARSRQSPNTLSLLRVFLCTETLAPWAHYSWAEETARLVQNLVEWLNRPESLVNDQQVQRDNLVAISSLLAVWSSVKSKCDASGQTSLLVWIVGSRLLQSLYPLLKFDRNKHQSRYILFGRRCLGLLYGLLELNPASFNDGLDLGLLASVYIGFLQEMKEFLYDKASNTLFAGEEWAGRRGMLNERIELQLAKFKPLEEGVYRGGSE